MTEWFSGMAVEVVEHSDATRQPRPDGLVFGGTVAGVEGIYVRIVYDNPTRTGGPHRDVFYTESGWRAWDGEFRWRLIAVPSCPACGGDLESRGEFDGRLPSSGVADGHEGFGETFLCEKGHWFTRLDGKLIPPEHILTVIEKEKAD